MKQMIVNVGGLTIEEKQRVNEALAKIKNISKIVNVEPDQEWFTLHLNTVYTLVGTLFAKVTHQPTPHNRC